MAKRILSIVIGTEYTKVCEVSYRKKYKNKGIKIYRSISFPTPPGTFVDGYITDQEVFGEELKTKLCTGKFKSDKVIFSILSSKIAHREAILPSVKEKRIMEMIKTEASEYFTMDMKDYILSYTLLEKKISNRTDIVNQKKQEKKRKRLSKKQEKLQRKALKKRSRTEIIADILERMETLSQEPSSDQVNEINHNDENKTKQLKKHMRLSVFAAPISLVKNYYDFAKRMHLEIVALDYYGNSCYQTMKRQTKKGINVFVQMNEQDTLISILKDGVLILQHTVDYGRYNIIEAVMEQGYYKVKSHKEALELLQNKNLFTSDPVKNLLLQFDSSWSRGEVAAASEIVQTLQSLTKQSTPENESELSAMRNVRDSLRLLSDDIIKTLDYFKVNHKQNDIDTIYLAGMGLQIQGIESLLTSEIGIPLKNMEKLKTYRPKKKAFAYRKSPSEFLACVGAVIQPVDFIPSEFALRSKRRSAFLGTIVVALICLIGSVGMVYASYTDYLVAKQELEEINNQYTAMPDLSGVHEIYKQEVAMLQDLQQLEEATATHNDYIKDIIGELEAKLPTDTVINSMEFTEAGLTLSITVSDHGVGANGIIAKIIQQLKSISFFKDNVTVLESSTIVEDKISIVTLSISCIYAD